MVTALTTIPELSTFTLLCITTWLSLQLYVRHYGPISLARSIIKFNSWIYTIISFFMFLIIITVPDSRTGTGITTEEHTFFSSASTRYIYHLSKFYEFLDILLVCAAGSPINLHFAFHHLTTPYLTSVRFLPGPANNNDGWRAFAAANTFHHVLMYAYFGGASVLRPILPVTGTLQLLVGIAVDLVVGFRRYRAGDVGGDGACWPYFASAGLLGAYFVLHLRDLRARRI